MILLGICGGIAAYKTPELVRTLISEGQSVQVAMTEAAKEFVTPLTLQTLSGNPVHTELFSLTQEQTIGHIELADNVRCVVIAPATANFLAKIANGLCDDLLSTVICATRAPVLLVPAMNVNMWNNPITQRNVATLQQHGYHVMPPESGELACGHIGEGRLPELSTIVSKIKTMIG